MDQKQKLLSFRTKRVVKEDGSVEHVIFPSYWKFDPEFSRKALAKMIIVDELPFMLIKHKGFWGCSLMRGFDFFCDYFMLHSYGSFARIPKEFRG